MLTHTLKIKKQFNTQLNIFKLDFRILFNQFLHRIDKILI